MNGWRRLRVIVLTGCLALAGCGGGGGGGGASAPAVTTVSGVASKGLIKNGLNNVKVFALNSDGTKGTLLQTASTGPLGEYSAALGSYTGAVLVEVSGTYSDEATGQQVTISANKPLRAALDSVTGSASAAVTPLTELAVQKAGAALTASKVKAANAQVSAFFNIDVIATKPVDPTASALNASNVTQAQKNYTLALAAISQMADSNTADAVYAVIANIQAEGDPSAAAQFTQALRDFTANGNNNTGVTAATIPAELANVGARSALLRLTVAGTGVKIYGVDLYLDLPSGVTLTANADGSLATSVLSVVGQATGSSFTAAKYTAASGGTPGKLHLGLVSSNGFAAGEFVDLTCTVPAGVSPTFSNGLIESGAKVLDLGVNTISGAAVTLTASF